MPLVLKLALLFLTLGGGASGVYYYKTGQLPTPAVLQQLIPKKIPTVASLPLEKVPFLDKYAAQNTQTDTISDSSNATMEETQPSVLGDRIETIATDATTQLQTVTNKTKTVAQQATTLADQAIEAKESENKPYHQSAIEYAQYQYCKQVVTAYEQTTR